MVLFKCLDKLTFELKIINTYMYFKFHTLENNKNCNYHDIWPNGLRLLFHGYHEMFGAWAMDKK